jgi:ElaA protein
MKSENIFHNGIEFHLVVKHFDELTINELYDITSIRQDVFVVEQECAFIDSDGHDKKAIHLILYNQDNKIVAYARALDKNTIYKEATLGRVLTHQEYRKHGLGKVIFANAMKYLQEYYGIQTIKIQAQSYLVPFYKTYGFEVLNEAYLDTGIYHNDMIKKA